MPKAGPNAAMRRRMRSMIALGASGATDASVEASGAALLLMPVRLKVSRLAPPPSLPPSLPLPPVPSASPVLG